MAQARAPSHGLDELRVRAEIQIRSEETAAEHLFLLENKNELTHELQVHQIELEMQNDELRLTVSDLAASRERYFELYDLAPVGYLGFSEKGLILEVNLTATTLLGGTRSSLLKQPLSRFFLPEDLGNYFLHRKRLFDTGTPQSSELQLLTPSGSTCWIRLDSTLAHDAEGAPIGRAAMINLSRAKLVERMLVQKTKQLDQALSRLAEVSSPLCPNCRKLPPRR